MRIKKTHQLITIGISLVWLINGFICKVLNLVPRHELIVQSILNLDDSTSRILTFTIGLSEIFMAIWILSRFKSQLNALFQIIIVALMNTIEFIVVPELLLWGKLNAFFAFLFIVIVFTNEFLTPKNNNYAIIS